jgi:hypothetical protein
MERESQKPANSLKARCDFAYASYFVLSTAFIASNIWANGTIPEDIKGNDIFLVPIAALQGFAMLLLFPALMVVAGAVAFPHPPAFFLACVSLFGFLSAISLGQTIVRLIAISALAVSLWWFVAGRKNASFGRIS